MEARRREPYDRERLEEERVVERGEPRLVERPGAAAFLQDRDIVRWAPIWGGTVAAFGLLALLGALGAAIGMGVNGAAAPGTAGPIMATIWGAIIVAISLFVGGYIAGRFALFGGAISGLAHSFLTWSTLLVLGAVLAAFGFAAGIAAMGVAPGVPGQPAPRPEAVWGSFIVMLIGLVAALIGGYLGGSQLRGRQEFRL